MNPYAHSAAVLQGVHAALKAWCAARLADAGLSHAPVVDAFHPDDDAGLRLAVLAARFGPWPKLSDPDPPVALFQLGPERAPAQDQVPQAWRLLGREMATALTQVWPAVPSRGPRGPVLDPAAPLARLPAPLQRWFEDAPDHPEGGPWRVLRDGQAHARLPTLEWRRPFNVRAQFLVLAGGGDAGAVLAALGAVLLGTQIDRVLPVRAPPPGGATTVAAFARALATAAGGTTAARLNELADTAANAADQRYFVVPIPDLPSDDLALLLRTLRLPFQPAAQLAVQVPLGAGPLFTPGTAPVLPMSTLEGHSPPGGG